MDIKAVKFRKDGFYSQPFVFGGEEGQEKFDKNLLLSLPNSSFLKKSTASFKGSKSFFIMLKIASACSFSVDSNSIF